MILQRLRFEERAVLGTAEKYFSIISVLNGLDLANREIQLLAFTAVNGDIGNEDTKKGFIEKYRSSAATIGNMISRLSKKGLLEKQGKKVVKVNKGLQLEFEKGVTLEIILEYVGE